MNIYAEKGDRVAPIFIGENIYGGTGWTKRKMPC